MPEQPGEREGDREAGGDPPIVADEEVPPETADRADVLHPRASCAGPSACRLRRSARTRTNEYRPTKPITPRIARSPPGQSTPAPSPPQKIPKLVSNTPTANLSVFSGTRASGPRTTKPATTTATTAAAAAAAARPRRPWVAPKVTTMKATSRPSSSTPLKATVNEYQSICPGPAAAAAPASRRSRENASASSWRGL